MKGKIIVVFGSVAAIAAGSGPAASAGTIDDSYTCQFEGSTIGLDDMPGLLLNVGGHGGYDFGTGGGGELTCVHLDRDDDGEDDTGVWSGGMSSLGSYQSVLCSNWVHFHGHPWLDPGNLDHPPGPGPPHGPKTFPSVTTVQLGEEVVAPGDSDNRNTDFPLQSIQYEIDFFAGAGLLTITAAIDGDGDTLTAVGGGSWVIQPRPRFNNPPGNATDLGCVNVPATDFDVFGAFTLATGSE